MITWNTSPGFLSNVTKGISFQYGLSCNTNNVATNFQVIAGGLPLGLSLSSPTNNPQLTLPTICGNVSVLATTEITPFTIRAADTGGNIADRAFYLNVLDPEPSFLFPAANLGIFPDGTHTFTSVAPITAIPTFTGNMTIASGSLPRNVSLDPVSGNITGYINPDVLYNTAPIYPNIEVGAPNLSLSANTANFAFTVQYDSLNTANFYMIVMRKDLYHTGTCNVLAPVYHDPIFVDATFGPNINSANTANIDLGTTDGYNVLYKFDTLDFEDNTVFYQLINGAVIPGNLALNTTTGWLSGYVNRDLAITTPYQFQVRAYKEANTAYQTFANCNLTIQNPINDNIVWTSNSNLGKLLPGMPSTLNVGAEVITPFVAPAIRPATANCTLKLVNVSIINGGNAFTTSNSFVVPGGICVGNAIINVSSISATGTIIGVTINPTIQQYTVLPSLEVIWQNPTGNANGLNAIFGLSFGVDTVTPINNGGFFDTVTVGFTSAGETISAQANATISEGLIDTISVIKTGKDYKSRPEVVIRAKEYVTAANPIRYTLVDGSIPNGCILLTDGLIVGIPSSQYYSLGQNTFSFIIEAAVGTNNPAIVTETDITNPYNSNTKVNQDFQTLVTSTKDFTLSLSNNGNSNIANAPRTNLSLEFLLDNYDYKNLYAPLLDETIVPNDSIFRPGDFYFGVAAHIRMLVAYGISPVLADNIQAATAKYHHDKQYLFTPLKWARSTTEGYEVIYVQPLDAFSNNNGNTFAGSIITSADLPVITADTTLYDTDTNIWRVSDLTQYELFPATLPNMINQLHSTLNGFDYNYLPTWMTDLQPNGDILGFIPAIPLLYVKPGTGQKIMFYLQQYYDTIGPALNSVQAITDRYIWNSGYSQNWDPAPTVLVIGDNTVNLVSSSTFIINPSIPTSYTPDLVPRTFNFTGNITVSLPANTTNISDVISAINSMNIAGIESQITGNGNIQITNIFGCPFLLYDGTNHPLEYMNILTPGTYSANISNVTSAGWQFNEYFTAGNITSVETFDSFLGNDDGATYIKFKDSYFITEGIAKI